jgi:hypothetical protein
VDPGALRPRISPVRDVSKPCLGQNAEVEQAADPARRYVYDAWIGCEPGIGFARSADGGLHFSKPITIPFSTTFAWDPAIAVARNGTVYVSAMVSTKQHNFPVVAASFDHGRTFRQVTALIPRKKGNFGDRDFIAAGPGRVLYLTWDYGPSAAQVFDKCFPGGSCAFTRGDLNVVMQKSTDGGKTWGPMIHVSPGFPDSGADSGPLLVEPNGQIDVLYQRYQIVNRATLKLGPAHEYFTSSADGGKAWSAPVRLGPRTLTTAVGTWWIDGAVSADTGGNLYATWDTQSAGSDAGWLSYSTDHGRTWAAPRRVTPDTGKAVHIVQVAGGAPGIAYAGWLADSSPHGYAQYLRPFSIAHGWLLPPVQVSRQFGNTHVWPGDTFGISVLPAPGHGATARWVPLSWGSAVGDRHALDEIYAAVVSFRG